MKNSICNADRTTLFKYISINIEVKFTLYIDSGLYYVAVAVRILLIRQILKKSVFPTRKSHWCLGGSFTLDTKIFQKQGLKSTFKNEILYKMPDSGITEIKLNPPLQDEETP